MQPCCGVRELVLYQHSGEWRRDVSNLGLEH
jgi:hypothetical protein